MKKLILLLLLIPILSFGQNPTIKKEINIKSESSSDVTFKFEDGEYTIVKTLETDLSNYDKIVLGVSDTNNRVYSERMMRKTLEQSRFIVEKKTYKKGKTKLKDDTLYLFWTGSGPTWERNVSIQLRDHRLKILYSADHKNIGVTKILSFLLNY
tara:strand:- start:191 stop:652 length:462 start_codon:yes stop_codon:yes gene_type:complete